MAKRSNVPKFGDWESEGNVPYTVYFDKARKNRGNEKMVQSDLKNQPQTLSNSSSRPQQQPQPVVERIRVADMAIKPNNKPGPGPPLGQGRARPTVGVVSEAQRYVKEEYGAGPRRGGEVAGIGRGNNNNNNKRAVGRGGGGNGGSYHPTEGRNLHQGSTGNGFAPLTPGRTRPKPANYTTSSDDLDYSGVAVPKFGGWNEGNPDSGENYTEKFNKVLNDRHRVIVPSPGYPRQLGNESPKKKCGCFPWSKK